MTARILAVLLLLLLLASGVWVRAEGVCCPIGGGAFPIHPGAASDLGASSHNWYAHKEYYIGTCPAGYEVVWRQRRAWNEPDMYPACAKDVIDAK